ncbi:aromatic ring-hydroxylating oxygenase subunit alpha [Singulisphaera sp. PoT]|uniref:aromatic ring-hydroxylating oxygenase subunit alpha n=1 Tax=Singulisphaera sp. PoT TaxID=3411797 RepID=UPI003BF4AB6B
MSTKTRIGLPAGASTLPACYYNDPDLFRREYERFFFGMWIYAGREEQVESPGSYLIREVGPESIMIARGEDGRLRAFYNVCRHRGTRICEGEGGKLEGHSFQCPYHAWTYDLQGRLIGAPHMDVVEGFRKDDYPLKPVGLATWDGHIFVNLSAAPRPFEDQVGGLVEKFKPWGMQDLRLGHRVVYDVKANWKLLIQNYSECLHCPIIHPAFQKLSHYLDGDSEPTHWGYLGGKNDLRPGVATISKDGHQSRDYLPGLKGADLRRVYFYAVLPNLLLTLLPDYMVTYTLWPKAVDRTQVVCEWHFHRKEVAQPGFGAGDAFEIWEVTNRQDWHVTELTQLGVNSRSYTPGPYSDREDLLAAFDRLVLEEYKRNGS